MRIADCARCHGRDHEGLAAPSIVGFARTQPRERLLVAVLDGNPPMGMPAYHGAPLIADRRSHRRDLPLFRRPRRRQHRSRRGAAWPVSASSTSAWHLQERD
ncbi:c-type cytochrome [Caballeronia hypogeia]|uniref:c-type cytochrome n=1 Tax=Caballeronia hypogeia TaxID=1777140 RepID=UPI00077297C7|nr:cytochrome c [Caballeronia hypogeia]